ncbi:MAG: hypothetical protein ACUVR8_08920 [Acidobacteriota bacterium]
MTRWVAAVVVWLGVSLWSNVAFAADYLLVLRDGKRLNVREEYRIVNEVAIFTTSDGRRISIALANIDITATERVNGQQDGAFRAQAQPPRVIGADGQVAPLVAATPLATSPKPASTIAQKPTRTLTNADFGGTARYAPKSSVRPKPSAQTPNVAEQTTSTALPQPDSTLVMANDEAYWRGRVRMLLLEIYTQQGIIQSLSGQAQGLQRRIDQQGATFLLGRDAFGNMIMLPREVMTAEKRELMNINERIRDAQARLTGLYVQYMALQEEARRLGVPPGWLR